MRARLLATKIYYENNHFFKFLHGSDVAFIKKEIKQKNHRLEFIQIKLIYITDVHIFDVNIYKLGYECKISKMLPEIQKTIASKTNFIFKLCFCKCCIRVYYPFKNINVGLCSLTVNSMNKIKPQQQCLGLFKLIIVHPSLIYKKQ